MNIKEWSTKRWVLVIIELALFALLVFVFAVPMVAMTWVAILACVAWWEGRSVGDRTGIKEWLR